MNSESHNQKQQQYQYGNYMPNQSQQPIVLPGDQYPSVNQHTEEERQAIQNNSQQQQRNQFQPGFNQQFQQMPPMMPPPYMHPAYYQHGMMPPPPQPQFLDQRCINLVKAKKSVKRLGTCQIVSHFIFVLINGIMILNDLIILFTLEELSKMIIHDKSGKSYTVQIEQSGLIIMTLFSIAMHALLLKWGLVGFKTFKPIVKDLKKQELDGMLSAQSHDSVEPVVKRSKQIKKFKKISTKVFIGTIVLIILHKLSLRYFLQSNVDTFLDAYYEENNQTQDGISSNQTDQHFKNPLKPKDTLDGFNYDSSSQGPHHHKEGEFDFNFNFDEMSKDQAKQAVTQIINWFALFSFIGSVVNLSCVGGCCLLSINKVKRSQKLREACLQQQYSSNSGIQVGLALPNSNGFQKVPTDESDLSSNNNVIPRGVVVNSLH